MEMKKVLEWGAIAIVLYLAWGMLSGFLSKMVGGSNSSTPAASTPAYAAAQFAGQYPGYPYGAGIAWMAPVSPVWGGGYRGWDRPINWERPQTTQQWGGSINA